MTVAERLRRIEERIAAACRRAERDPRSVRLVGASKTQPAARIAEAYAAGLGCMGENRVQEGVAKAAELPAEIDWHLLGPLQSNKVRPAVRLFSHVHAIDRASIAFDLDREAAKQGRTITGLLEVNLGGESSKHGFAAETLAATVAPLAALAHCRIRGLMAIPPPAPTGEGSRPWFRELHRLRVELDRLPEWDGRLTELSMGMSGDFEVAIEEGATFVRVGSDLFGPRDA